MSSFVAATVPDLLRLLVIPLFAWAAVRDQRTRRVPFRTWKPLIALGGGLLLWDGIAVYLQSNAVGLYVLQTVVGITIVAAIGIGLWFAGHFGGADASAFFAIAVLFPTQPAYALGGTTLPIVSNGLGIFSLTILINTFLVAAIYPVGLAVANAKRGKFSFSSFVARRVSVGSLEGRYGTVLNAENDITRSGFDLDVLRMYLRWRGIGIDDLQKTPTLQDRWGAEAFLEDTDTSVYQTNAEDLRHALDLIVEKEGVWFVPGIPFLVPVFVGLLLALTVGDMLIFVMVVL